MRSFELSEEEYQEIIARLKAIEVRLKNRQHRIQDVFLDNQEFVQLMYISKRTAQNWRDRGLIAYSQVGSKIYYRMSDILNMLDEHRHTPNQE